MPDQFNDTEIIIISKNTSFDELGSDLKKEGINLRHHSSYTNIETLLLRNIFDFVIIDKFDNKIKRTIEKINKIYPFLYFYIIMESKKDMDNGFIKDRIRVFQDRNSILKQIKKDISFIKEIEEMKEEEEYNSEYTEFCGIIGHSQKMLEIFNTIEKVSKTDTNVLILGDTGTGKELLAKAIHIKSNRKDNAFIAIDCGAIPSTLLEDELFGHEKGAFTDATMQKKGKFELADGGTLFLDEIGNMPIDLQMKVLRVLQEREYYRLGGSKSIKVDMRVISATKEDLDTLVNQGNFRDDLYYRLNVIPIYLPPLKERKDDIPLILCFFSELLASRYNIPEKVISHKALKALMAYDWPGNIRELQNIIDRIYTLYDTARIITLNHLPDFIIKGSNDNKSSLGNMDINGFDFNKIISEVERDLINRALEQTEGNKKEAARLLGLKRTTLIEKLKRINDF